MDTFNPSSNQNAAANLVRSMIVAMSEGITIMYVDGVVGV